MENTYNKYGVLFTPKSDKVKAMLIGHVQIEKESERKEIADKIMSGKKFYLSLFENQPKDPKTAKVDKFYTLSLGSQMKYQ